MLNIRYLNNIFLYFTSVFYFQYAFIIGFYYLIQDYFLMLMLNFRSFAVMRSITKEEFKYLLIITLFFAFLF